MPRSNPYYRGAPSDHFDGVRFFGPSEPPDKRFSDLARMLLDRRRTRWPASDPKHPNDVPPRRSDGIRVVSAGHSSLLIQLSGLNLLVDPVWSERVSPVTFAGPKRAHAPAIAFDDLPPVDAVLITHNHYDHLDRTTIARLWQRDRPRIIAPLGNDAIIGRFADGLKVECHDWGDSVALSDAISVHVEPALHWSGRGLRDRRMALWCSYVITGPEGVVYHVGDTAYGDGAIFRAIKAEFGAPRLAFIPIGAYEPRWFMAAQHVNPDEAVQIMLDCGAERALGHHWGTFQLTYEAMDAPRLELDEALAARDIPAERFRALMPGVPVLA